MPKKSDRTHGEKRTRFMVMRVNEVERKKITKLAKQLNVSNSAAVWIAVDLTIKDLAKGTH